MKLIIGLGNPDKEYNNTRHNVGFMAIDFVWSMWQKEYDFSAWSANKKLSAEISEGKIGKEKIILAKPLTYMNNSGIAVGALAKYYKIKPENIIVIHDDLDIRQGEYKVQRNRSSAGHNGIKSIIEHLGTQDFHRIRIGIGREKKESQGDSADFVLNRFTATEKKELQKMLPEIDKKLLALCQK